MADIDLPPFSRIFLVRSKLNLTYPDPAPLCIVNKLMGERKKSDGKPMVLQELSDQGRAKAGE